jgi:hypothetical protein
MEHNPFKCPRCERLLPPSGEIVLGSATYPVYQCEECITETTMFGSAMSLPYTFAVDDAGLPFDPADDSLPS